MSNWGAFLVVRTPGSLLDLDAVVERSAGLIEEKRYGEWVVGEFEDHEVLRGVSWLHGALTAETKAPSLSAAVVGSVTVVVDAHSETAWLRAPLDEAAMRRFFADEGRDDYDDDFPQSATEAAEQAVLWAVEAGLRPDPTAVQACFGTESHSDVETSFLALLGRLGIT